MRKLLGLMLVPILFCSCAHNNWQRGNLTLQTQERIADGAQLRLATYTEADYKILWDYYGHFNTAGVVAKFAGCDDITAARIAYFSQAPDNLRTVQWGDEITNRVVQPCLLYNAAVVGFWGVLPPFWSYRQRIQDTLHSLHGGDQLDVRKRQARLQAFIAQKDRRDWSEHWKIGFLIHALGDSYAHVYPATAGGKSAYGPIVGHVLDGGTVRPDYISQHFDHYEAYVRALYQALGGDNQPAEQTRKLNDFLASVKIAANSSQDAELAEAEVKNVILRAERYPATTQEILLSHRAWKEEIHLKKVNAFLKQLADKLAE